MRNILQSFCLNSYIMDYTIRLIFKIASDRILYSTAFKDNECYKNYSFYLTSLFHTIISQKYMLQNNISCRIILTQLSYKQQYIRNILQSFSDNYCLLYYVIRWIIKMAIVRTLYSRYLMTHQLMDTYYHTPGTYL